MIKSLNPRHLTPAASLNRLRIAALPDKVRFAGEVIGRTAYELASTAYLAAQVRTNAAQLNLSSEIVQGEDRELPRLLTACFDSSDESVRFVARAIIHHFGRNIGCILLTLKQGDPANRAVRTDWDDSYWAHWESIQTVFCGGGLMSVAWWATIYSAISEVFAEVGITIPDVRRAAFGDSLPLVGAARWVSADTCAALVFDFGSSFVKRARARYANGSLIELCRLPAVPTQFMSEGHTAELFGYMTSIIAQTYLDVTAKGLSLSGDIIVSLAAYVDPRGQPYERQGGVYAALRNLSPAVQTDLSDAVSVRVNAPVNIQLLHDGSAAACAYAGASHAATIMFGTALGIGFPPADNHLRPLHQNFTINQP